jgi:O-antigen ligase
MPELAARATTDPGGSRFLWGLMGACTVAGLLTALVLYEEPLAGFAVLFLLSCALAGQAILGFTGFAAMVLVGAAFFLMKRFDEGLMLSVGSIDLQLMYSMTLGLVIAVGLYLSVYRLYTKPLPADTQRFLRQLGFTLLAFVMIAFLSLLLNRIFPDPEVLRRDALGEFGALGLIVLPVFFALYLPRASLDKEKTLLSIRGVIALGGLAGLIMAAFGVLPSSITGALGWTGATGGTVDLVRGRLPLGHANSVAAIIMLLMPAALLQGLRAPQFHWRAFGLGCAALMFCGVLFSLSRSALLCLIISMGITFLYYLSVCEPRQRWTAIAGSGLLVFLLIGVAGYLFTQFDFSRFWSRRYHEEASTARRLSSMQTALVVWQAHPFLGVGPDAVFPRLELRPDWTPPRQDEISPIVSYKGHISAENPHNIYLSTLAEFGLAGFVAFFALLYQSTRFLLRQRRLPGVSPEARDILAASVLCIGAFLAMGLFEAVLMTGIRVNLIFWIFVGLFLRYAVLCTPAAQREGVSS